MKAKIKRISLISVFKQQVDSQIDPEAARSREGCEQEKGDLSSTRSRCGPLLVYTGPSRSLR